MTENGEKDDPLRADKTSSQWGSVTEVFLVRAPPAKVLKPSWMKCCNLQLLFFFYPLQHHLFLLRCFLEDFSTSQAAVVIFVYPAVAERTRKRKSLFPFDVWRKAGDVLRDVLPVYKV